jgi:hypothetical protein
MTCCPSGRLTLDIVYQYDMVWHGMIRLNQKGSFFGFATTKLMSEPRPAAAAVEAAKSAGFPGRCARARIHRPLGIRGFIPVLVGLKGRSIPVDCSANPVTLQHWINRI